MISKPFLSFTLGFLSLAKIGQTNLILQTLLISGSVVTITSLSQWNIFDMRNISGGTVEHMMIINALSILQFLIGWRTTAKKAKSEVKSGEEIDSKIIELQSEINHLKSRLIPH